MRPREAPAVKWAARTVRYIRQISQLERDVSELTGVAPGRQESAIGGVLVTVQVKRLRVPGEPAARNVVREEVGGAVRGHEPVAREASEHVGAVERQRAGE